MFRDYITVPRLQKAGGARATGRVGWKGASSAPHPSTTADPWPAPRWPWLPLDKEEGAGEVQPDGSQVHVALLISQGQPCS